MCMYPEFIAIYVGLAIVLVLLIVVLILQIVILKNGGGRSVSASTRPVNSSKNAVVFCKSCAARFSAAERVCPKCGAPR